MHEERNFCVCLEFRFSLTLSLSVTNLISDLGQGIFIFFPLVVFGFCFVWGFLSGFFEGVVGFLGICKAGPCQVYWWLGHRGKGNLPVEDTTGAQNKILTWNAAGQGYLHHYLRLFCWGPGTQSSTQSKISLLFTLGAANCYLHFLEGASLSCLS